MVTTDMCVCVCVCVCVCFGDAMRCDMIPTTAVMACLCTRSWLDLDS
jgi:hypothetical protein